MLFVKKIALVGCGDAGSRHLQALSKLQYPVAIDIVEPKSHDLGKERLARVGLDKHTVSWYKDVANIDTVPDLSIVATGASRRADIIKTLVELGHTRFLIEKMVCQSAGEYESILEQFAINNCKGWVNTNQACFTSFQTIRDAFAESPLIHFSVAYTNNSALGTNIIHFMDLFARFTGDYSIHMDGSMLHDEILPNKRGSDLIEFSGTVTGHVSNGSTIAVTSLPVQNIPSTITIIGDKKHIVIDETNSKLYDLTHPNSGLTFEYEYISVITTRIDDQILRTDSCCLTTVQISEHMHREIFRIFNTHLRKLGKDVGELCPIT